MEQVNPAVISLGAHKHSVCAHTHTHTRERDRLKGDIKSIFRATSLEIKHLGTGMTKRKSQAVQTVNKYDSDRGNSTVHVLFLHHEIMGSLKLYFLLNYVPCHSIVPPYKQY